MIVNIIYRNAAFTEVCVLIHEYKENYIYQLEFTFSKNACITTAKAVFWNYS